MQATQAKHTPGPWCCYAQADGTAFIVATEEKDQYGCRKEDIVRVPKSSLQAETNARLIAAAPEMLLALKDAVLFIDEQHEIFREVAKAKGVSAPSLAESPRFMGILETINKAQGGE